MQSKKILIIDDNLEYQRVLVGFIKSLHPQTEIKTCDNGKDGVAVAESWLPDIIFVDYLMPLMDGLVVIQTIKNSPKTKNIMIVMMSADKVDAMGCSFVKKPISRQYIQKVVEDIENTRIF